MLHAVSEATQQQLLASIAAAARPGDQFAAEFRTTDDGLDPKVHRTHSRGPQDGPAFARALTQRFGFTVVDEQEGTGLSPYRGEDPALYRVLAASAVSAWRARRRWWTARR